MGVVYLEALDCPFSVMDNILEENSLPKIILVDFHAEATGEKVGLPMHMTAPSLPFWHTYTCASSR